MIELQGVTITAGQFLLEHVSLKVRPGEYAVLMGQTGQGKTTILEAVCGLRNVTRGKVLIHDQDVTDFLPGDRRIGYVPQDLALFPTMTVQQNLEFALKLRKWSARNIAQRIAELSDILDIGKLMKRTVKALSGGESQRVALGRALSFQPSVLLLDEPFSALDEQTRTEMHQLLRMLTSSTAVTTLHITHSTHEAEALASRRFILKDGQLTEAVINTSGV